MFFIGNGNASMKWNLLQCWPVGTHSAWRVNFKQQDSNRRSLPPCSFSANSICIQMVSQSNGIQLQGGRHHVQVTHTWLGWCRDSNRIIFSQPWSNFKIQKFPIFDGERYARPHQRQIVIGWHIPPSITSVELSTILYKINWFNLEAIIK